jgi:BolA protein
MSDRVNLIKQKLAAAIEATHIEIVDDSHKHAGHAGARDGGGHFNLNIVSSEFKDKSLIQRHRIVYAAVDELMNTEIHALSINAQTPEEFSSN